MKIIAFCAINDATIQGSLGAPEYSYYFVYRQFLRLLAKAYTVVPIEGSVADMENAYRDCLIRGEPCICLFFSQPHKIPAHSTCPIIPVFAWEFNTLPEDENGGVENDWGWRLAKHGWAITHSDYSVKCVKQKIRSDFPVISIPSPVWDDYRHLYSGEPRSSDKSFSIQYQGLLIDSAAIDLKGFNAESRKSTFDKWISSVSTEDQNAVDVDGVVYLSLFNPDDKRKNWQDMLRAFCWEFKQTPDATLILKFSSKHWENGLITCLSELYKSSPFSCRVLILHGYMDEASLMNLVKNSDYVVNTSHGEGQCLPLMEGMSAGKPAISPNHTAMADYIRPDNAFIVDSSVEPTYWPHDPRQRLRTLWYRIDWESLCMALRQSYRMIKNHPDNYLAMSSCAFQTMQEHCSYETALQRLKPLLMSRQGEYISFDRQWRFHTKLMRMIISRLVGLLRSRLSNSNKLRGIFRE